VSFGAFPVIVRTSSRRVVAALRAFRMHFTSRSSGGSGVPSMQIGTIRVLPVDKLCAKTARSSAVTHRERLACFDQTRSRWVDLRSPFSTPPTIESPAEIVHSSNHTSIPSSASTAANSRANRLSDLLWLRKTFTWLSNGDDNRRAATTSNAGTLFRSSTLPYPQECYWPPWRFIVC